MSFSGLPLLTVVTYEDVQPGARWTPEQLLCFKSHPEAVPGT